MSELDANLGADPSTAPDQDAKDTVVLDAEPSAGSSPAKDESDAELLSITRDVIDKTMAKATASSADGEVKKPETDLSDGEPAKPDDDEYTDVPFHKHPRFQALLRKSKENETDAKQYRVVDQFLRQNGVDGAEAADALQIAGLMKTNPVEAWKRLKPTVQKLLIAAGEILPEDLQHRVQAGEMAPDIALEIAREKAARQALANAQQYEAQRREREASDAAVQALMQAAQSWEADRDEKDPNYAEKKTAILKEVLYLQSIEGRPNTPQGVRAQLKKAYDEVNRSFVPQAPAAQKTGVRPVTGGQISGSQRDPAPKSTLDIIHRVVGR